jgi:phosphatidate phosphatase APP1
MMKPVGWLSAAMILGGAASASAEPATIEVYFAMGEPGAIHVEGRVLGGTPLPAEESGDWAIVNALRTVAAVASDELPGVTVTVGPAQRPGDGPVRVTTDEEGFFTAVVAAGTANGEAAGKLALEVRLEAEGREADPVLLEATVLPATGATVVVTDFDDTLAASQVSSPLLFAARLVLSNGAQLAAVPDAAACLTQMATDADAVVVLSGNPVNFHTRLATFLGTHGFPPAWFLLRDFGVGPAADPLDVGEYKRRELERLAEALPHARFVLLGDSGEQDANVYRAFRAAHGERVERVLIRSLGGSAGASGDGVESFGDYAGVNCDLGSP